MNEKNIPVENLALILATHQTHIFLPGGVVGLGKQVGYRVGSRAWVNVAVGLVQSLGVVEHPSVARLATFLLLLLVAGEADEFASVWADERTLRNYSAPIHQPLACS